MSRFFFLALLGCHTLPAQSPNTLVSEAKFPWIVVRDNLLKMAEKMPAENYSFKPTPEVQTFAQRIAHIAAQIGTCSGLTGERKTSDANNKTAKADLVAALKSSFDACDAAWDSMNDKTAMEMVAGRGGQQNSKLGILIRNTTHDVEMYGYLSVYLRLKSVVPPTSDRG